MKETKRISFLPWTKAFACNCNGWSKFFFFFVGTLTKMPCEEIISSPIGEEKGMIVAFGPCCFANRVLKKRKERKGDTVPLPLVVNNLKSNHHDNSES